MTMIRSAVVTVGTALPVSRAPQSDHLAAVADTGCTRTQGYDPALYPRPSIGTRAALWKAVTFKVAIGKFGDDDTAEIKVDDRVVGWLERVHDERFKSASSYARISFVSHYTIVLTDDAAFEQLKKHDVASRAEAKLEVAHAFGRAWKQLTAPKTNA